ncbi:MAG: RDD family protein, partial [Actinobacteria bacterium]|nr:RDD family protein [Actinomycetota bacterium]
FIDWILATLIATGVVSVLAGGRGAPAQGDTILHQTQWWTLLIFAVMVWLLTALTGLTVGKRILGMRVVRLDGRPVGLGWSLVRTVLLLAVVPPLFTDRDQRGLHDRAANTVVIRS